MKKIILTSVMLLVSASSLASGMQDDPLLTMVKIDKLEVRNADGDNPAVLDAYGWVGKDLHKLWIKTEVERVAGETEDAELQLLYSRAAYPFWDLQVGWRRDFKPEPERDWLAIGMHGLAPYMFEVDAALFIGENSRLAARFDAEYEYLLTQRWVLTPELEINAYSKDDVGRGLGSGVTDLSAGLRLRYEIRREFAPYVGINWDKQFGDTADLTEATGGSRSDSRLVVGIRAWF